VSHDPAANCLDHHHDDDFHEYAHDVDAKHAGTASLLPPATGPPCLLPPCFSFPLPLGCFCPLPFLLSAFSTHPFASAGGASSFHYGDGFFCSGVGSSVHGLVSCLSVYGEGLHLHAHEMSKVIHRLPDCQSCNSGYTSIIKKCFRQSEHISPLHVCTKHQSLQCVIQGGVTFCATQRPTCVSSFYTAWTRGGYCCMPHTWIVHLWAAITLMFLLILVQLFVESSGSVLTWCTAWIRGGCCCTLLSRTLVTDIGHTRDWHTRV
jgi:hypothetical protein